MKDWKEFPLFTNLEDKAIRGVYAIVNTINGKVYIGKTTNMKRRIRDHLTHLRGDHYVNTNPHLQSSFDLYGEPSFTVVILEQCESNELLSLAEHKWIEDFNSCDRNFGYNLLRYDDRLSYIHSSESIEKMRLAKLGKKMPQEVREKIRKANAGRHLAGYGAVMPQSVKDKLSKSLKGRKYIYSEQRNKNISKALTGKKLTDEHRRSLSMSHGKPGYKANKKVLQLDMNGNILNEFYSQGEASRVVGGCTASNISRCCNGEQKTAGGFKWKHSA